MQNQLKPQVSVEAEYLRGGCPVVRPSSSRAACAWIRLHFSIRPDCWCLLKFLASPNDREFRYYVLIPQSKPKPPHLGRFGDKYVARYWDSSMENHR